MAKDNIAISVSNVSKSFRLPHEKHSGFKQLLINTLKGKREKGFEKQEVLKGVSFDVQKGDFIGIVGRNGSGKSTLLKILAGIYRPDEGTVEVDGSLVPFIELGVGFNPELTGRENVFLNGALLGFDKSEIQEMYQDIVDFAEIEDFMDQKLKNYSSGMQVRLAFSIAIRARSDILVLDEVLAVGDEAFQRKCNEYFEDIKKAGKTVILVTHEMAAVRRYCTRAILVKDGEIMIDGTPEDVANEYSLENVKKQHGQEKGVESVIKNFKAELLTPDTVSQSDEVRIKVSYETTGEMKTYPVCDLRDIDRNTPLITAGSRATKERSVSRVWSVRLGAINNTNVVANIAIRDENHDILGFLPDGDAPRFLVRRNDYPDPKKPTDYALLFDKGLWEDL